MERKGIGWCVLRFTLFLTNSINYLASCQNKFAIFFTFYILFRMQNDQTVSSSPSDRFAFLTKYSKWTKIANLLDFVAHKQLFVSEKANVKSVLKL